MLYGVPNIISPELLKILHEMGHGDEIVIGDGNFPAASNAKRLVRADGHGVPELLKAILQLFPLDTYKPPVMLMQHGENEPRPRIWENYENIIGIDISKFVMIERENFYERAQNAYAILATSESALYANIILKKGVIK